jgi:hypothetical protein
MSLTFDQRAGSSYRIPMVFTQWRWPCDNIKCLITLIFRSRVQNRHTTFGQVLALPDQGLERLPAAAGGLEGHLPELVYQRGIVDDGGEHGAIILRWRS